MKPTNTDTTNPRNRARRRQRRHVACAVLAHGVRIGSGRSADAIRNVTDNADVTLAALPPIESIDPATQGVQLLARAYGYGQSWDRTEGRLAIGGVSWEPTDARSGAGDEANPAASAGITLARETETLLLAGKAVNPKDKRQNQLMQRAPPAQRAEALAWSEQNDLKDVNGKTSPYRVREFEHWKQSGGVMFVPTVPSSQKTLRALSRAKLAGPLRHMLLFAATHDLQHWAKVVPFAVASGHPAWACEEVAREFCGAKRTVREGAKDAGVRAEDWSREVRRARAWLDGWMERAGARLLAGRGEYGVLVEDSVYLPTDSATSALGRHVRDPATSNHGDLTGITAERWWRPQRQGLDRFGREPGTCREWSGEDAERHCLGSPAQSRLIGMDDAENKKRIKRRVSHRDRIDAEDNGEADPADVNELSF